MESNDYWRPPALRQGLKWWERVSSGSNVADLPSRGRAPECPWDWNLLGAANCMPVAPRLRSKRPWAPICPFVIACRAPFPPPWCLRLERSEWRRLSSRRLVQSRLVGTAV